MTEACTRCGTFYARPGDVFELAGKKLCAKCYGLEQNELFGRALAVRIRNGAYAMPLLAMVAVFFATEAALVGLIFVVCTAGAAGLLLFKLARDEQLRTRLGGHFLPNCVCLFVSLLFALAWLGLIAVGHEPP